MRLVLISDTHGRHERLRLPEGDILVVAGDFTERGLLHEIERFARWMTRHAFERFVVVAGNHDFGFEQQGPAARAALLIDERIVYLEDSGADVMGLRFWGSPQTPRFFDWAFNRDRGRDIRRYWDRIPEGTDVLVTHGPPYGILDHTPRAGAQGCLDLRAAVLRLKPRLHVFGHLHSGYGQHAESGTTFVNAAVCDERYRAANAPVVIDLDSSHGSSHDGIAI